MPRPDPDATADWYRRAAERDLPAHSPLHASWAAGVATDAAVLDLIDQLPREHRQPSLVFSAAAFAGVGADGSAGLDGLDWPCFRDELVPAWPSVAAIASSRHTQTNEIGRCAPLLAALQGIDGPIALIEVGAAAGLCLHFDRYSYVFERAAVVERAAESATLDGTGGRLPTLACRVTGGGALPDRMPDLAWRTGLDLAPLSIAEPEDVRWLEALIPPDRPDRLNRLRDAIAAVRDDPPRVIAGDALADLPALVAEARDEAPHATLVVASLGTLVYLPPAERAEFQNTCERLRARTVTLEGVSVLPEVAARAGRLSAPDPTPFLLARDGHPLAFASAHGDRLSFLS